MGGSRAISRWRSSSSTPVCRLPGTISGSRSASLEPDTNSKIYFTLSPEPRVRWDRRGILANPISGTAVLEYGPAEILPPVGAISKHPARLCRPGRQASRAHPRGKPGFSTFESGCGRETDCLLEGGGFEPSVPRGGWRLGLLRRSYGKFRRANLRFAPDSPLEGDGFELPVPREMTTIVGPRCVR